MDLSIEKMKEKILSLVHATTKKNKLPLRIFLAALGVFIMGFGMSVLEKLCFGTDPYTCMNNGISLVSGGYISLESPEAAKKNSDAIIKNAEAGGAEMIITACPLCRYNLIKSGSDIPVVYFTEILAEALGVKEETDEK